MKKPDVATLLRSVRRGDRGAWKRLVESQARRLYAIAWAVTRDNGTAEDVVQDVFLRIAQGRVPVLRRGAAEAFLARMAARAAIDTWVVEARPNWIDSHSLTRRRRRRRQSERRATGPEE